MKKSNATISRRAFLSRTGGLLAASSMASSWASTVSGAARTRRGTILGPGRRKGADASEATRYFLTLLDLDRDTSEPAIVELDFFGHGLALDPTDPYRAALFEKRGTGACLLDLESGSVVRSIDPAGREFYGHGAFSPDGSELYSTETIVEDNYRGVVVVRNGETLEEIGEFPTFGESPHDCVLRDNGKTLVVTNGGARLPGGSAPSVTYIDVPSRKLLERVTFENPDIGAGHLALDRSGSLAVTSAAREWMSAESLGAASFRAQGTELRSMEQPVQITGRMKGESLSLAIHEASGIVGVTNPYASLVTFWDLEAGKLVRSLDLAYPRGIAVTLDGSEFVLSYGKSTSLVHVSTRTLEPIQGSKRSSLQMSGSHIVVHDFGNA